MTLMCAPCLYDFERPDNQGVTPRAALTFAKGMALCEDHWEAISTPDDVRHVANWAWNKKQPPLFSSYVPAPTIQPHWASLRSGGIGVAAGYCACGDPDAEHHTIYGQNPWPIPEWAIKENS